MGQLEPGRPAAVSGGAGRLTFRVALRDVKDLLAFLRQHRVAVQASVSDAGGAQAAVVGIAVTDRFEIVFDTLSSSRKAQNLLERLKQAYYKVYTDGPSRLTWPGLIYVRVGPTWVRYSDYTVDPPQIVEFTAEQLSI
jgi:hypothetical protein